MIEAECRLKINQLLEEADWTLDPENPDQNVFIENSVNSRLSIIQKKQLGRSRPDYTLFDDVTPIAIIEAKKSKVSGLESALIQARNYAAKMGGVPLLIACNGTVIKTEHYDSGEQLYLNGYEVTTLPPLNDLRLFVRNKTNEVATYPDAVQTSFSELVNLFSDLDNLLRAEGIRAGVERFSVLANILFLKLLSEQDDDKEDYWGDLLVTKEKQLVSFLNNTILPALSKRYGGDVVAETNIKNGAILKKIILGLAPLSFTTIDEDVKGLAFEHFLGNCPKNDLGEYYTPRHIVRFMVQLANPKFKNKIYDPFCGTGGFLTEAFKHICKGVKPTKINSGILQEKSIFGSEITQTSRIAKMNLILFGDGHSGIKRHDSLSELNKIKYDLVLSNIPFSQSVPKKHMKLASMTVTSGDQACTAKCFDSLKKDGSMAVIVPEGMLVNRKSQRFFHHILKNSRVRMIVRLPAGCFNPYAAVRTTIIYLTNKNTEKTSWFYNVRVHNHGYNNRRRRVGGVSDLDKILFWFDEESGKKTALPKDLDISIVSIRSALSGDIELYQDQEWETDANANFFRLSDIATLENGKPITEKETIPGAFPVIAGGEGRSPYSHDQYNQKKNVVTVSKSGANAGYVWWHGYPIWSSDSIAIRSKDESRFLTKYLYFCMKLKQTEIYDRQQGTGQPHIYCEHIKDFPIPDISLEEQKNLLKDYIKLEKAAERGEQKRKAEENELSDVISQLYSNKN